MEDYIVLISTISIASLLLALLWILRRSEVQSKDESQIDPKEEQDVGGDEAKIEPQSDEGESAAQPSVDDKQTEDEPEKEKYSAEVKEEEEDKQISADELEDDDPEVIWEDQVETNQLSDLDLNRILSDLDKEVGTQVVQYGGGEALALQDTEESTQNEAAQLELVVPPQTYDPFGQVDLEESGIFDVDESLEGMDISGRYSSLSGPEVNSEADDNQALFSGNYCSLTDVPETGPGAGEWEVDPAMVVMDLEQESIATDKQEPETAQANTLIDARGSAPDSKNHTEVEKDGQTLAEYIEETCQTPSHIPTSQAFLPDLIQETMSNITPVSTQVSELPTANLTSTLTCNDKDDKDVSPLPVHVAPVDMSETVSSASGSEPNLQQEPKYICDKVGDEDLVELNTEVNQLLNDAGDEQFRQMFSCAIEIFSRDASPEQDIDDTDPTVIKHEPDMLQPCDDDKQYSEPEILPQRDDQLDKMAQIVDDHSNDTDSKEPSLDDTQPLNKNIESPNEPVKAETVSPQFIPEQENVIEEPPLTPRGPDRDSAEKEVNHDQNNTSQQTNISDPTSEEIVVDVISDPPTITGPAEEVSIIEELIWRSFQFHDDSFPTREDHPELYELIDAELMKEKYAMVGSDPVALNDKDADEGGSGGDGPQEQEGGLGDEPSDGSGETRETKSPLLEKIEKFLQLHHPASPEMSAEVRFRSEAFIETPTEG